MLKFLYHGAMTQEEFQASWHPTLDFDTSDYIRIPLVYLASGDDLISEIVYSFSVSESYLVEEFTGIKLFWVWAAAAEFFYLNQELLYSLSMEDEDNKYIFLPFRWREEDEEWLT